MPQVKSEENGLRVGVFIEYQIAAQQMVPDDFLALAAYGDNGPGYIGTKAILTQGGYEAPVTRVGPEAEDILLTAMRELLESAAPPTHPSS